MRWIPRKAASGKVEVQCFFISDSDPDSDLTCTLKMLSRPSKQTNRSGLDVHVDDDDDDGLDALVSFGLNELGRPPPKCVHTASLGSHLISFY